ncbi:hypothetical protein PoB_003797800 [Plakobranchus ocellatus]|uniref:Uncharacterized protein n=1 Tax=Plakobranchus ocellatus TaxID=259542 RepID=A0AAV4AYB2_9GAST|nr:hypothetical protein PoB_003797800 [Plakobranchus ocellatus]
MVPLCNSNTNGYGNNDDDGNGNVDDSGYVMVTATATPIATATPTTVPTPTPTAPPTAVCSTENKILGALHLLSSPCVWTAYSTFIIQLAAPGLKYKTYHIEQ